MTTVSVIIPCYNSARTLRETVKSALAQTLKDIEIIIVNDGSTDNSLSIAEILKVEDPRIVIHSIPNRKLPGARNYGIEHAVGEFVAPLDADDLWHPTYLEKLVKALRKAGETSSFAYSFLRRIDDHGKISETRPAVAVDGKALQRSMIHNFVGTGSGIVIRRAAANAVGGYDERVRGSEDYLMQIKLAAVGEVVCIPECLIGYRQSSTSMSTRRFAMAQGSLEALGIAISEIPGIDPAVEKWALARAQMHGVIQATKERKFLSAAILGLKALHNDVVGVVAEGFTRAFRRAAKSAPRGQYTEAQNFFDVDPAADVVPMRKSFRKRRLDIASAIDRKRCKVEH